MMEKTIIGEGKVFDDPGTIPRGFVYREQRGRYPGG